MQSKCKHAGEKWFTEDFTHNFFIQFSFYHELFSQTKYHKCYRKSDSMACLFSHKNDSNHIISLLFFKCSSRSLDQSLNSQKSNRTTTELLIPLPAKEYASYHSEPV